MTRTHRFLGGISLGYVSLVATTVVGLWLTPFVLGRIGSHDYGLWLITTQILGYLMLLDLGVVALAPREMAYATGRIMQGGQDDLGSTFARFRSIVGWQVIPTAIVCLLAWWAVAARWEELRWPLAAILAAFLIAFPLRLYHATLQGLQELAFIGKVQLAAWTTGTIVTISLVLAQVGLAALAAGWIVTQAIIATGCALRLRNRFAALWAAESPPPSIADARELLQRSGWVSLSQVGQVFLNGSDVLLLGAILGPAATVPYVCTGKLISVLAHQPQLLMQAAAPAIAEMRTSASREHLARIAVALMRAMLILSGAVACFVLAANEVFVTWWVGASQFAGETLTVLLLAVMLARHFATTLVYALFSFGHEKRLSLTAVGDGLVVLLVTAALAWGTTLGLASAAIGSLAGVVLVSIPACSVALARELQITLGSLIGSLRGWSIRFALAAAASVLGARVVDVHGFVGVAVLGGGVAIIYAALMWPLALEAPLGPYVRTGVAAAAGLFGARRQALAEPRP